MGELPGGAGESARPRVGRMIRIAGPTLPYDSNYHLLWRIDGCGASSNAKNPTCSRSIRVPGARLRVARPRAGFGRHQDVLVARRFRRQLRASVRRSIRDGARGGALDESVVGARARHRGRMRRDVRRGSSSSREARATRRAARSAAPAYRRRQGCVQAGGEERRVARRDEEGRRSERADCRGDGAHGRREG